MRLLLPSLILAACSAIPAFSQAAPTASRDTDLVIFAEYQSLHTDYGRQTNGGVIAGLDYSRFFRNSRIVPSLEIRANYSPEHGVVGEQVVLGGVRADIRLFSYPRLHPFVNFLIGAGQVDFIYAVDTPNGIYSRDNSVVLNYGAGLSYGIGHGLELQAEYQHQNWNLSPGTSTNTLTPASFDFGVRYHVPTLHFHRR